MMKGDSSVYCRSLNRWEPQLPSCFKVKSCGAFLGELPNGHVFVPQNLQLGAKVTFVCNTGYQLKGNSSSHCVLDGVESIWNSSVPVCEQVICKLPQDMSGFQKGLQMKKDYYYGDNVALECEDGYTLEGSSQSQCQSDASWDPPLPKCVSRSNSGLIAGIFIGIIVLILFIIFSYWMIMKFKKRNSTNEKCKEVGIYLNSKEDSCVQPQSLLTSQENNSTSSPARNSLTQEV